MFYALPTEDAADQNRFIRTEDLIEGVQEFKLISVPDDAAYPYQITVTAYLQTSDKTEVINLKFSTPHSRDVGISTMLRDLWHLVKVIPEKEKVNGKERKDEQGSGEKGVVHNERSRDKHSRVQEHAAKAVGDN